METIKTTQEICRELCKTLNKSYKQWEHLRDLVAIINEFYFGHNIRLFYGKDRKVIVINIDFRKEYNLEDFLAINNEFNNMQFITKFERFLFERL